jgi:hypothetical protein
MRLELELNSHLLRQTRRLLLAYSVEKLQISNALIFCKIPFTWETRYVSFTWLRQLLHNELSSETHTLSYQKKENPSDEPEIFHRPRNESFSTE